MPSAISNPLPSFGGMSANGALLSWVHAELLIHKLDTFCEAHRKAKELIRHRIWWLVTIWRLEDRRMRSGNSNVGQGLSAIEAVRFGNPRHSAGIRRRFMRHG